MNGAGTASDLTGLAFVVIFSALMAAFSLIRREQSARFLREIGAFSRLRRAFGLAVEAGQRLHVALGGGGLQGLRGASGLIGMSVIQRVTRSAAVSDRPLKATSGEAAQSILSQDVLRAGYRDASAEHQFDPATGQLTGLTPVSYAAGVLPILYDEQVSVNLILGSLGSEAALISEAAQRTESLTIGGSENLSAQAVLFATLEEPLVGEELYAAGAYLQAGRFHLGSVLAQDLMRWLLALVILLGALLKLVGIL